jgi:CO/xanthine dehydrogenase Mo-binding subunit
MSALGAAAPRKDADPKVRGTAAYGVDVSLPGMIHGAILRSPVAKGRIRRTRHQQGRIDAGGMGGGHRRRRPLA